MDVSVVIPAYNGEKTLPVQLKALAAQKTDISFEVIVSDNGSQDNTRSVVESIAPDFPVPLRVVDSSDWRGASHARNVGVDAANGEVIAFCDCDDYVTDTWVQSAWDGIQSGADVLGGEIRVSHFIDNHPENHHWELSADSGARTTSFGGGVTSCNLVFRKSAFEQIGGFDESLPAYGNEDSELCIRASFAGHRFMTQPGLNIYFKPTVDKKVLFKKIFDSGIAQAAIWHHHQDFYGEYWKLKNALKELFSWLVNFPSMFKNGNKKQFVRGAIVRAGSLWGSLVHSIKGWPAPRYFDYSR